MFIKRLIVSHRKAVYTRIRTKFRTRQKFCMFIEECFGRSLRHSQKLFKFMVLPPTQDYSHQVSDDDFEICKTSNAITKTVIKAKEYFAGLTF